MMFDLVRSYAQQQRYAPDYLIEPVVFMWKNAGPGTASDAMPHSPTMDDVITPEVLEAVPSKLV